MDPGTKHVRRARTHIKWINLTRKILMICSMWCCKFIIQYWGNWGRRLESETSLEYTVRPSLKEQRQPEFQQCQMWVRCGATGRTCVLLVAQPLLNKFWQFLLNPNIYLLCDPVIRHLDIYSRAMKAYGRWEAFYKDPHTMVYSWEKQTHHNWGTVSKIPACLSKPSRSPEHGKSEILTNWEES